MRSPHDESLHLTIAVIEEAEAIHSLSAEVSLRTLEQIEAALSSLERSQSTYQWIFARPFPTSAMQQRVSMNRDSSPSSSSDSDSNDEILASLLGSNSILTVAIEARKRVGNGIPHRPEEPSSPPPSFKERNVLDVASLLSSARCYDA